MFILKFQKQIDKYKKERSHIVENQLSSIFQEILPVTNSDDKEHEPCERRSVKIVPSDDMTDNEDEIPVRSRRNKWRRIQISPYLSDNDDVVEDSNKKEDTNTTVTQNTLSSKNKTTENEVQEGFQNTNFLLIDHPYSSQPFWIEQSAINDDESPSVFAGNSANEERRTNHEDKSSDVEPEINVIELFDAESTLVEGSPKIPEDDITTYENETDMPDTDDENVSNKVNPASINNTLENSHLKIHGDDEMITSRNKPTIVETKILPKGSYVLVKEEKEQIKYKREASNRKVEDDHTPVKKSDRRRMKLEFKYDSSSPSPVTNQNVSPVTPTANNNEQNPTMYCEEKTERIAPKKMTADEILKKVDYYVSDLRCLKRPAKTPRNVTEKSVVTSTITKTRSINDIASKIYDFRNDIDPCEGSSKSLEFDSRCSSKKNVRKHMNLLPLRMKKR
ncbi:uncharacterized protein [Venturia canescens]|uniref:uncharacterized protein n=1 Tax=Venturia canescens TaxID=32260 RepID=UPI001C9D0DBB|nr:uncharacterized protein LOC122407874 [Venturia canescens]